MGMFLLYAAKQEQRGGGQYNSVLVEAATEEAARAAALANQPAASNVLASWTAVDLGTGTFPDAMTCCYFQGRGPVSLLGMDTGGNAVPVK